MKRLWNFFASVRLTIVLTVLICLVSAWGSLIAIGNARFFGELDRAVLLPWLASAGIGRLDLTLWIFALVFLTALFALNTAVCTADRIYSIVKSRLPYRAFFPHMVHIGFLVALLGHLVGSVWGFRSYGNVVFKGSLTPVPHERGLSVRLDGFEARPSVAGELESLKTSVTIFKDGKEAASGDIRINGPLVYEGIAFYHVDQGKTPTGLVLDIGGESVTAAFNGAFGTKDGGSFRLGEIYPDFAADRGGRPYSRSEEFNNPYIEVISGGGAASYLDISRPGTSVESGGRVIRLLNYSITPYVVLTINRDPGIWLIIAGSAILVAGMAGLLLLRGGRGELLRQRNGEA